MQHHRRGRRYYLNDIPLNEALEKFQTALHEVGALETTAGETIPLEQASGRVTAGPVWAKVSSPHYDAAAMDGVAVKSRDTVGATETSPVRLSVGDQAVWLDTGDPLPEGFDAVIMVEVVHEVGGSTIEIRAPAPPYQHVRPLGEDIVATELVLPENHRLRPQDLAACASAGLTGVIVRRYPSVAIIPTGSELVPPGAALKPGDIIESNSLMLAAMIGDWGGRTHRWDNAPDDRNKLKSAVLTALETFDMALVNAGSSAGSEDYTASVVEELGQLLVHGVALRPGHPVVLGVVEGKPVLGIPGYQVSAAITCELFVKPLVERKLGLPAQRRNKTTAVMSRRVPSPAGEDEFLRVRLGKVEGRLVATPVQRGAGVITSLVHADGLVLIPRLSEGVDAGDEVEVELLRPAERLDNAIVVTGSHDLTLDLLASELRRVNPEMTLSSSNVGSLGGLLALNRREAHVAGCHLLDEETGRYNTPYVRRYLKEREVVVMNLVDRVQGLIVPAGNPKSVESIEDLGRDDVAFVNRQRGSGTRMLLDFKLKSSSLAAEHIRGYEREEYTHLAVAAAVAGGRADVGLGILSAARAMGLDFVPLLTEQYDLVVPREFYESDLLQPLLALIRNDEFKSKVDALGGYDTARTGEVVAELGRRAP